MHHAGAAGLSERVGCSWRVAAHRVGGEDGCADEAGTRCADQLPDSPRAARLRELADQEITQLLRRVGDDLALDVLGLLTAARGGLLAVADLAMLTGSRPWQVRGVLQGEAARTLQQVGPADASRYTFAHETLLARCQQQGVGDPSQARRIHEWAATWRDRGWPEARDGEQGTPLYLLDRYPRTLYGDPPQLAALAGDAGWVTAATRSLGVDAVLAELKTAAAAAPGEPRLAAMHAVVRGQAHHLRDREAVADPGFVPRQLCLQAAELGETLLAADCHARQLASDDPGPVLQWTTRRASPAMILELGRDEGGVAAVAVLPDGRVVTGGFDGRVLVWDPAAPGAGPVELGRHDGVVAAVAVLPDGRVVTGSGGDDGGRVLVWDPAEPGAGPVELGRGEGGVAAVAVLPDGRVVTGSGGDDGGRVLLWDPAEPGAGPVELGRGEGEVAVAVLPDGRVVTGGRYGGRVLVWDPAEPGAGPVELGRGEGGVAAVAVLPDGRVVTGGYGVGSRYGRVLVWDPGAAQRGPAELGGNAGAVAVAVLPDGRVVTGGSGLFGGGRVLVWDPGAAQRGPVELGRDEGVVAAVAVLPDGRVVTGSTGGRVLVWDPAEPGAGPAELGRDEGVVAAVAVLPDGRVVTGSGGIGGRVLVWDPGAAQRGPVELGRDEGGVLRVAVLPDGRVVTGGGGGYGRVRVWDPAEPGAARPSSAATTAWWRRWRCCRTGGWSPAAPAAGCWCGTRRSRAPARPSSAATRAWWRRWRCCRTGGWSPAASTAGCWCGTRRSRAPARPSSAATRAWWRRWRCCRTGGWSPAAIDGRVLVWDPAAPGAGPAELGRHQGAVAAVAVLPDGRVVTGGHYGDRVRLWDVQSSSPGTLLACSAYALATSLSPSGARLFIGHARGEISCWEVRPATQNTPGTRQRAGGALHQQT